MTSAITNAVTPVRLSQTDQRHVADMLKEFACPKGDLRRVQLVRPFSVLSASTYSAPLTLPVGPAYLAGTLEAAGYVVGLVDGLGADIHRVELSANGLYNVQGAGIEALVAMIPADSVIIGISLMFSQEWVEQRALIKAIRAAFPNAWLVAGGEHVSALTDYVLRDAPEINFAISGEGEFAFLQLVHALFTGGDLDTVSGLSRIDQTGTLISASPSRRIATIGELPRPAWHLCNVHNYFIDNWTMGIAMGRNMPILATRGCPYQCTFCSNPNMWTTRYTMRPATDVVDEIEWLVREYQANSIDFFDLTAIVKRDWILEFCAELERREIKIVWQLPSGTRSEALDDDTLAALYRAGCRLLVYAPESGSEETLRLIKKKVHLPKLVESVRSAVRQGHTVKVNIVIGFPKEQLNDMIQSVLFSLRMALIGVDDCNIAIFSPYPGSELYQQLRAADKVPAPSDRYFNDLVAQFDFTNASAFCETVSGQRLTFIRVFGLAMFYVVAYLSHPSRLVRLVRNIFAERFQASNLFEQRISDALARRRQNKKSNME